MLFSLGNYDLVPFQILHVRHSVWLPNKHRLHPPEFECRASLWQTVFFKHIMLELLNCVLPDTPVYPAAAAACWLESTSSLRCPDSRLETTSIAGVKTLNIENVSQCAWISFGGFFFPDSKRRLTIYSDILSSSGCLTDVLRALQKQMAFVHWQSHEYRRHRWSTCMPTCTTV